MGLFKKKPGGTLFGNILRKVANSATGGILGSGANRLPVTDTSPVSVVSSSPVTPVNTSPANGNMVNDILGTFSSFNKVANEGVTAKVSSGTIIGIGVAAIAVILVAVGLGKRRGKKN